MVRQVTVLGERGRPVVFVGHVGINYEKSIAGNGAISTLKISLSGVSPRTLPVKIVSYLEARIDSPNHASWLEVGTGSIISFSGTLFDVSVDVLERFMVNTTRLVLARTFNVPEEQVEISLV